jgi:hypothetical protein
MDEGRSSLSVRGWIEVYRPILKLVRLHPVDLALQFLLDLVL